MTKVGDLHIKWMKKKEYRAAYSELAPEFTAARAAIKARAAESDVAPVAIKLAKRASHATKRPSRS
jgi:hypothetical protein